MRRLPRPVPGRRREGKETLTVWVALSLGAAAADGDPARGALLAGLGGCAACHTAEDGPAYAGGHAIETRWGTFYGTNLTPDPVDGIGSWSEEDFARAMRRGRSPERSLWPAFPFPFFAGLTDGDLADLYAFLRTVPAVAAADRRHDVRPGGLARWAWHTFLYAARPFSPPTGDVVLDRGAYLAEVVGHCQGCHTPLGAFGRPSEKNAYTGSSGPPYTAPNLTPHEDGTAGWSHSDWTWFLESGLLPDGDAIGGGMRHVVRDGTSRLTPADREALAAWMMALPPRPSADEAG